VVETGSRVLKGPHSPREEEEGKDPCGQFAQKQEEICHFVQDDSQSPDHVPQKEEEGISGRGAEVFAINRTYHNISVSVEELDEFLQTPETTLQTSHTFKLVDEGAEPSKCNKCEIMSHCFHTCIPERSPKGREHWEGGHVIWFDKCPVVRGKGPSQGHLPQSRDKVGAPEEEEHIVELQSDQVFVINGLSTIESKKALGVWTLSFHWTDRIPKGYNRNENRTLPLVHKWLLSVHIVSH
uniref:Uncharacterized protein n=1 Tax=Sphaeramia orbicularis TaxID=375764 RepID=A0A673CN20_9TELE